MLQYYIYNNIARIAREKNRISPIAMGSEYYKNLERKKIFIGEFQV